MIVWYNCRCSENKSNTMPHSDKTNQQLDCTVCCNRPKSVHLKTYVHCWVVQFNFNIYQSRPGFIIIHFENGIVDSEMHK